VATTPDEAVQAAAAIDGPVALKVSHPEVQHKTDIGGVVLSLDDPDRVAVAAEQLLGLRPGATVLVEAMATPGVEMLVSATRDGVVPSLVVGTGGIFTEILSDVVVLPLPADADRVAAALPELLGHPMLTGARGRPPAAVDALCTLAVAVGRTLLDEGLSLIELNPVFVTAAGAVAVDAVVCR
jgi:succinyl-CoA synthetase beta subunit